MQGERIRNYLRENGIAFKEVEHSYAVSAQRLAAAEHESGWTVAKPVILK